LGREEEITEHEGFGYLQKYRHQTQLDLFWLRDENFVRSGSLPTPTFSLEKLSKRTKRLSRELPRSRLMSYF
jgi:hypothetical protein